MLALLIDAVTAGHASVRMHLWGACGLNSCECILTIIVHMKTVRRQQPDPGRVLATALLRAASLLGMPQQTLARVVGVSEATLWRVASGQRSIDPVSKEGELALLLVRLYRSLDALVGGNDRQRVEWMGAFNRALNGRPVDVIRTTEGLARAVSYVDAARATL